MSRRTPVRPVLRPRRPALLPLALLLVAGATGCFRSTGLQRSVLAAEEIPVVGGDRPAGLKAAAGPGDYYLGNDYVEVAVDGTPFGERDAIAGAASGGSIVDVGYIELDTSYRRVSMPSDSLERLTPLVNQDPELQLVFSSYTPKVEGDVARVTATGGLHDPSHKLAGASWDAQDRVVGVTATHTVELARLGRTFTLTTTVRNQGTASLPIRNIADGLLQRGGGFRALVPAQKDAQGNPISGWGVEIPGTSFAQPLLSSVQAPMVAFMGSEGAGLTEDGHLSLGLLPLDADAFFVASDPQQALHESRPRFPERVVVGSLPAGGSLAPGQALTHTRRLYLLGGTSGGLITASQATGLLNQMIVDRATLRNTSYGTAVLSTFGTATQGGPLQTEIRFERNLGTETSPVWQVERVEWQEPIEVYLNTFLGSTGLGVYLPAGTYRIVTSNRDKQSAFTSLTNMLREESPNLAIPVVIEKEKTFQVGEALAPERPEILAVDGSLRSNVFTYHYFSSIGQDQAIGHLQPLKITLAGQGGTSDPVLQRNRVLGSIFDAISKEKLPVAATLGGYRFRAGNQVFGASFRSTAPEAFYLKPGSYIAYGTRGPLSVLDAVEVRAFDGQDSVNHAFLVFPRRVPSGWTSFDLPGATQATTGGLLPAEALSSALAEDLQVVGMTETDRHPDPDRLYRDFRLEFGSDEASAADRTALGDGPYVLGARTSELPAWGAVSALSVPKPTRDIRAGARASRGWTLADFLAQAEGAYNVVHRPRGPKGLFSLKGFNPAVPLGTGVNAWWSAQGTQSLGRTQGSFEALELLRGEGFDPANPGAWFAEFKQVRADWFAILNQQTPAAFTKALGLSSARFSLDTPVGHARTYLRTGSASLKQEDLGPVLTALKAGAAVASTGPLLDVSVGSAGPGGLVPGPLSTATVAITLTAGDWVPVDELRIVVNGQVVQTVAAGSLNRVDSRTRTGSVQVPLPAGKDAWIVVEAGVPLATTGAYAAGSPWAKVYRGIYPVAVTNPIFVDATGGGYAAPGL